MYNLYIECIHYNSSLLSLGLQSFKLTNHMFVLFKGSLRLNYNPLNFYVMIVLRNNIMGLDCCPYSLKFFDPMFVLHGITMKGL